VGLVDRYAHAMAARELDDLGQRRDVAVHREDGVGDDQRAAPLGLAHAPRQVLDVRVAVDEGLRACQSAAVDDRRVVELVGEDDLTAARQRRDHADVRQVARTEEQRRLRALEVGQALLQAPVHGHRARHQPRRPGADAPAHRGVGRRLAHAGVVREPQVVVRAQQQHGLAVEHDARALGAADHAHAAIEPELLELLKALVDLGHVGLPPQRAGCAVALRPLPSARRSAIRPDGPAPRSCA
jgi:hypothetical protein